MAILNGVERIHNTDGSEEIKLSLISYGENSDIESLIGQNVEIRSSETSYIPYSNIIPADGLAYLTRQPVQNLYRWDEPKNIEMEKVD